MRPFGVFIALDGHRRHALVPPHHVADGVTLSRDDDDADKVRALSWFFAPGAFVFCKVVGLAPDPSGAGVRISGSLRCCDQETGADLDPNGMLASERPPGGGGGGGRGGGGASLGPPGAGPVSDTPPSLGIHRARIARTAPFGAFVWIEGWSGRALVHWSQVAEDLHIDKDSPDADKEAAVAACVPAVGGECWVKVVAHEEGAAAPGGGPPGPARVSASLKLVDQRTGDDRDPNGLKWRPRGGGGAGGAPPGARPPVGAGAGAVAAGDAVAWGHLAADTYGGGGKQYDLVVGGASESEDEEIGGKGAEPGGRSPSPVIQSVEHALEILRTYGGGGSSSRRKRHTKEKKEKKGKRSSRRSRSRS